MILGIDVSTYLEELEHGAVFLDGTVPVDPLDLFVKNGVNRMRIRVWNDPYAADGAKYLAGTCDMDHYIRLARLAKSKGFHLMMDIHYSDFWADPGKQFIPKAWQDFGIDEMEKAVYAFTKECLERAVAADVAPEMIQVGNEITNGILWPVGKLELPDGTRGNYGNFCRLVSAGCRACREVTPDAKIILHLERSGDHGVYEEFFTKMEEAGVPYDVIGASYYPYWHGTPDAVFDNLRKCRRFGKPIMVVEMGYGFTAEAYTMDGSETRLVIDAERAFVPGVTETYPLTPEGQKNYIRDLLKRMRDEEIAGVFYWEPLWLPGKNICWASESGQAYIHEEGKPTANEWANQCLFDYGGKKLPAFDVFA